MYVSRRAVGGVGGVHARRRGVVELLAGTADDVRGTTRTRWPSCRSEPTSSSAPPRSSELWAVSGSDTGAPRVVGSATW